jgi:ketosteroid isomerase-like protein
MSQENVEVVRRWYASLEDLRDANPDDDPKRIDEAFRDYLDGQFELRMPPDYPEGEQVFHGRDGYAQAVAMFRDAWAEFRLEPERFLDAGDRVVVFVRVVAKGGASGVPIEIETGHVWTVRSGQAASVQLYRDRSEVLEAAGLSE